MVGRNVLQMGTEQLDWGEISSYHLGESTDASVTACKNMFRGVAISEE